MTKIKDRISHLHPCTEALEWLANQADPVAAWNACPRGDWMLWLAARIGVDHSLIVLAACDCARTALRFVPDGEMRPLQAIEAAERWAADPTEENREAAARAAAYADADARTKAHQVCADLVRARISAEMIARLLED